MNAPDKSIVCVYDSNDQIVGCGFLVSKTLVVTCAHIVQSANLATNISIELYLDFPLAEQRKKICGRVVFIDINKDVACLEISDSLPNNITPANLVIADNLWGHTFRAFGFPRGYADGVWSSGVLRGNTGQGWLQIEDIKSTGFSVQPGFSGGLVWDDKLQSVVGMVVAAEIDRTVKSAFCIPIRSLINVYPALKNYSTVLCPYRSLDVFTENDKDLFFGRERFIAKIVSSLKREPRFLAILGPSGSGKSSATRAGLIPALQSGKVPGSERWHTMTIRPGIQPFTQLENIGLININSGLESSVNLWLTNNPTKTRLVLFIDQFEELLIVTSSDIRDAFITELLNLLNSSLPISVIITLRSDFLDRFTLKAAKIFSEWMPRGLTPISPSIEIDELYAMIASPAQKSGIEFEEGLIDRIIKDAVEIDRAKEQAESTILPLLEFSLTQMWNIKENNVISHNDYQKIGGVAGGLSLWADKSYYDLNDMERRVARRVLTDLVNIGDEILHTPNTKRIRQYDEIVRNEIAQNVVQKMIQARLLVAGYDISLQQNTIEIIHEALIYNWALLSRWIEEDKEYLHIYNHFAESAKDWERLGKEDGLLYRGGRLLGLLKSLENRKDEDLSLLENKFLEKSKQYNSWLEQIQHNQSEHTIQLQREQAYTETLLRILVEASSSLDLDNALTRALSLLNNAINADCATIMLLHAEDNLLHHRIGYGQFTERDSEEFLNIKLKVGEGLAGWVVQHREAILTKNYHQDARWRQTFDFEQEYCSSIAAPLLIGDDAIGALLIFHRNEDFFDIASLNFVRAIASQIAVTINNARLYELIRDQAERLGLMLRKEQEDASRSQAILQSVADGVLVTGTDNLITFVNTSTEHILDLQSDQLLGKSLESFDNLFGNSTGEWMKTIRRWSENPSSHHEGDMYAEQLELKNGRTALVHLAPVILQNDFLGTVTILRRNKEN